MLGDRHRNTLIAMYGYAAVLLRLGQFKQLVEECARGNIAQLLESSCAIIALVIKNHFARKWSRVFRMIHDYRGLLFYGFFGALLVFVLGYLRRVLIWL